MEDKCVGNMKIHMEHCLYGVKFLMVKSIGQIIWQFWIRENIITMPICGGEAKLFMNHKKITGLTLWCECQSCYAKTTGYCPKDDLESFEQCKELALKAWNRRIEE